MPITQKRAMDGAKAAGAATAGSLFLGPVVGPAIGGIAATAATGRGIYTVAGIAASGAYWLASPNPGVLRGTTRRRGWK